MNMLKNLKNLISTPKRNIKGPEKFTLLRSDIINYYLGKEDSETHYLEIGVRNPKDNFELIQSNYKDGVDPEGNCNYPMTSDDFFSTHCQKKYDLIFIDGLHLHEQVYKDILNSLEVLKPNGTIIMHDCSPPTIWHQREDYKNFSTPAKGKWNGTTWKAFVQLRCERSDLEMFVIDTDWGVGVIKKGKQTPYQSNDNNLDYHIFDKNRTAILNLISVDEWHYQKKGSPKC